MSGIDFTMKFPCFVPLHHSGEVFTVNAEGVDAVCVFTDDDLLNRFLHDLKSPRPHLRLNIPDALGLSEVLAQVRGARSRHSRTLSHVAIDTTTGRRVACYEITSFLDHLVTEGDVVEPRSSIPDFRGDGYLPEGIFQCTESEVLFRFASITAQRRRLSIRLRRWIQLGRRIGAHRLLVDGSFVTAKPEPNDIDAVMLIPSHFRHELRAGNPVAVELERMFLTRHPEELFAAEDFDDWDSWAAFFSQTREFDGRRKGLIEVQL